MDFAGTKEQVSLGEYAGDVLRPARGGLVCPRCGSGEGPHGTPAFSVKGDSWRCFSCGAHGDVFDLAGAVEGTEEKAEQYRAVRRWAGLPEDDEGPRHAPRRAAAKEKAPSLQAARAAGAAAPAGPGGTPEGRAREAALVDRCAAALWGEDSRGLDYARSRGFTDEEAAALRLGWDAGRRRLVIPFSARAGEHYHIDRDVTGEAALKYLVPDADDAGGKPLYGLEDALAAPVAWVVEGVLDAMAIDLCGGHALAMAGCAEEAAVAALRDRGHKGAVVVCPDFDAAGEAAASRIRAALDAAGVPYCFADEIANDGRAKDAAELFARDRALLAAIVAEAEARALDAKAEAEERAWGEECRALRLVNPYDAACGVWYLSGYENPVPTGLAGLDEALGGGLGRGVHVLGAVSSLGKTTLMCQVADSIAASGRPVLFVTVEQSADELVRKSLARYMWRAAGGRGPTTSARELGSPSARASWGGERAAALLAAVDAYNREVSPYLVFLEGDGQPGAGEVAAAAAAMKARHGLAPVVFVDYLQLLRPASDRMTDKQAVDANMTLLRQLSRDLRCAVVVVSSLNRSSYSGVLSLDSFKESGGIEYGADVLLALQPAGVVERSRGGEDAGEAVDECRASAEREVEVRVLKSREGAVGAAARMLMRCAPCVVEDMGCERPGARTGRRVL